MQHLYTVYHRNPENDDVKQIGVFSSLQKAQAIIEQHKKYKGFNQSAHNFWIDTYQLDKPYWQEGYFTKKMK